IGRDPKILTDKQTLTLGLIKLIQVVRHAIRESRIGEGEMLTIRRQPEPEQEPIEQRRAGSADEQVSLELRTQSPSLHKTDWRRRQRILPTEFRIDVLRAGQHIHSRQRLLRRGCDVARRPAKLLKIPRRITHLDRFEFIDAAHGTHRLNPTAIEPRRNAIDLVERVVAVLLSPQSAAERIEVHPEAVTNTVGEDFLDVRSSLAREICRRTKERIVRRRRTIVVEPQYDSSQVCVIRLRTAELIVRNRTATRQILQEPAPAVIADNDVNLAVGTNAQHTTVMIATRRLARVLLQGSQLDKVSIEGERRTIPHVPVDAISKQRHLIDIRGVGAGAAFRPIQVNKPVLCKLRM